MPSRHVPSGNQEISREITELMLQETKRRLHAQNVLLELTPAAVE
jgi:hypothetical protein